MEIYLITAGALFLFYYGILCFYTGKWDSTFARFWLVGGIRALFDDSCDKRRSDAKAFVLSVWREYGSFFLRWSFLLLRAMRLEERRTAGI